MKTSTDIAELAKALAKAQADLKGAHKSSVNPFFKSKYADLESIWEAIRQPLCENGLAVSQTTDWEDTIGIMIVTTLMHSSGQWIQGRLPIMASKLDPQGIGSALSYSRRYALAAIVGVVQVDDDAEAAHGRAGGKVGNQTAPEPPMFKTPPKQAMPVVVNEPVSRTHLKPWTPPKGAMSIKEEDFNEEARRLSDPPAPPSLEPVGDAAWGNYVAPFGKLKGKKLADFPAEFRSYAEWIKKDSQERKSAIKGDAMELVDAVDHYFGNVLPF